MRPQVVADQADRGFQPRFASRHDCVERERNLRTALVDDPGNVDAWTELADVLRERRKFQAAEQAYARAAQLGAQNVETQLRYAEYLDGIGDSRRAHKQVDRVLKLDRKSAPAHALKGKLLREEGRNAAAMQEFELAWRANPPAPLAGIELARWDLQRGVPAAAADKLALCVAREPGNSATRRLYAQTLAELGRNGEAIREWETLVARGQAGSEGTYRLAELYALQGMQEEAWNAFAEARRIDPKHPLVKEVGPVVAGRARRDRAVQAYPELVSSRR